MALNQVPVTTLSNINRTSCSLHCVLHPDCYYFNLQRDTGICELLEFIVDPSLLEAKTGWDFIHTNLYSKAVCKLNFVLHLLECRTGVTTKLSCCVFSGVQNDQEYYW